jgi:hypothetical protein
VESQIHRSLEDHVKSMIFMLWEAFISRDSKRIGNWFFNQPLSVRSKVAHIWDANSSRV